MYYVRIYSSEKDKSLLFPFETEKTASDYLMKQYQMIKNYFESNPEKYSISLHKESNCFGTVHLAYKHILENTVLSVTLEFEILSDLNPDYYSAFELLQL